MWRDRVRVPSTAAYRLFAVLTVVAIYASVHVVAGHGRGAAPGAGADETRVLWRSPNTNDCPEPRDCPVFFEPVGFEHYPDQQQASRHHGGAAGCPTDQSRACPAVPSGSAPPPPAGVLDRRRCMTRLERRGRYFRSRMKYDSKADSTYQCCRLIQISGDIETNPGPATTADSHHRRRPPVTVQPSALRVLHQNSRSLRNKLGVLRARSPELRLYDVIGISETWLSHDVTDGELHAGLSCHTWFRRDRPTHGGESPAPSARACHRLDDTIWSRPTRS